MIFKLPKLVFFLWSDTHVGLMAAKKGYTALQS